MKKSFFITLALLISIAFLSTPAQANHYSKAKDFLAANMVRDAVNELNQEIKTNPKNANAHLLLASLYIDHGLASKNEIYARLNSAYSLAPRKLGNDVSEKYSRLGDNQVSCGKINNAITNYAKAIQINKTKAKDIAKKAYKQLLPFYHLRNAANPKCIKQADTLANFIISIDSAYADQIKAKQTKFANSCLKHAATLPRNHQLPFRQTALRYLNETDVEQKLPTPKWTVVYKKPFIGVGNTGGDDPDNDGSIYTAEHGKDILVGDRYTVTDTNFEVWVKGDWHKFPKGHWLPSEEIQPGNNVTFRNYKGKKFNVVVERKL